MFPHRRILLPAILAALTVPLALADDDCERCKDYPGISRMPGYYIRSMEESQFDSFTFKITEAGKEKEVSVEGHRFAYRYFLSENATPASALQIVRNFQNAARAAGGQTLWETNRDDGTNRSTTLRFKKGSSEIWLQLEAFSAVDKYYEMTIVEKQAMQQDVVADAASLARDISTTGRVAVYGIYFDTAKADLKPESDAALSEIAKLLKQNVALKLFVVGHTDNVGALAANLDLSKRRADAVTAILASKYGVAAQRLIAQGVGPLAPVDTNDTEAGRAKNRRVELVKQ